MNIKENFKSKTASGSLISVICFYILFLFPTNNLTGLLSMIFFFLCLVLGILSLTFNKKNLVAQAALCLILIHSLFVLLGFMFF